MPIPRTNRFLTRTAILLSLTLLFEVFGRDVAEGLGFLPSATFLVGTLVNLCLLVATAFAGTWAGVVLALLAPLGTYAVGTQSEPVFLACIAAGNLILVLCFAIADQGAENRSAVPKLLYRAFGILAGGVLMTAWMWGSVTIYERMFAMTDATKTAMAFAFGWPQAVVAAAGGALALVVLLRLERSHAPVRRTA